MANQRDELARLIFEVRVARERLRALLRRIERGRGVCEWETARTCRPATILTLRSRTAGPTPKVH